MKRVTHLVIIAVILFGCKSTSKPPRGTGKLAVIATTGMLYDAVINIGGDDIEVEVLMGPGVDPHLYKATQGDLAKLSNADLIIYNGLYLEGKMGEILQKLSARKPVVAAAESITEGRLISTSQFGHSYDPHVWFDVSLWKEAVMAVAAAMIAADTAHTEGYRQRSLSYLDQLDSLHQQVQKSISSIPQEQRVLITAHDAFGYFGKAYNIDVKGLQGLSTASDFGLKDIAEITDLVIEKKLGAIFVETSVSDKAIKAVVEGCRARGHKIAIGGYLYSDAMGEPGTMEGTYIGMVDANVRTIVSGLYPGGAQEALSFNNTSQP